MEWVMKLSEASTKMRSGLFWSPYRGQDLEFQCVAWVMEDNQL